MFSVVRISAKPLFTLVLCGENMLKEEQKYKNFLFCITA